MPSNKNAVIRYMFLDQMLSDRHNKYTCEDLRKKVNERLEEAGFPLIGGDSRDYERFKRSGRRVIQLDLLALQEAPFNMEIDSSEKIDGSPVYRYADQTQSLFSKQLSDDEKRLLQEVLNTLGQFSGLDSFDWLNDLQNKLNDREAFGRNGFDNDTRQPRKIISFSTNEFLAGKDYLGVLFSFISNRKVVDVIYQPFGETERTIRLYPYLLKQYNDRWYLIGTPVGDNQYAYDKDFYLNLALDRIKGVLAVEHVDYIDCEDGFEERYEDIVGITYIESDPYPIVLAVEDTYVGYIETKPLHGSQFRYSSEQQLEFHHKYPAFDGYTFYGLRLKLNREFFNLVYRFGRNIILVDPPEILDSIIKELEDSLSKMKSVLRGKSSSS